MSVCTTCYDAGAYVNVCSTGLIFGALEVDTDYVVALQSISTSKIQSFAVTSDGDGEITIDTPLLSPNTTYEIWVSIGNINAGEETITIESIEYTCIVFSVMNTDEDGDVMRLTPEI